MILQANCLFFEFNTSVEVAVDLTANGYARVNIQRVPIDCSHWFIKDSGYKAIVL